jgi:hypothetical protein
MSDIYKMWKAHLDDPAQHADLTKITDDNGDEVIEVNRPEEIDALIAAITKHLTAIGYPLEGKRVVWVSDDRVYRSGAEYRAIPTEPWEASAYGNMHKYTHDVLPARAALGAKGCTECHSPDSDVFFASVLDRPFDENAQAVTVPQFELLGLSRTAVTLGAFRETYLKPVVYLLWLLVIALAVGAAVSRFATGTRGGRALPWLVSLLVLVGLFPLLLQRDLRDYALPSRLWLDSHHFLLGAATLLVALTSIAVSRTRCPGNTAASRLGSRRGWPAFSIVVLLIAMLSGVLMSMQLEPIAGLTRYAYTVFDMCLVLLLLASAVSLAQTLGTAAIGCEQGRSDPKAATT